MIPRQMNNRLYVLIGVLLYAYNGSLVIIETTVNEDLLQGNISTALNATIGQTGAHMLEEP